ncbi:MAG: S1C family serine protease [Thermoanaerobaculales bacterium]
MIATTVVAAVALIAAGPSSTQRSATSNASAVGSATPMPEAPPTLNASALYDKVSSVVVSISATSINAFDRNDRISHVAGSGVIIDPGGLILTNSHVVYGRQLITVMLDDGTMLPARLVGADPVFDVAVVRIPPPTKGALPVATLGNSAAVRVGEEVFALGSPLGLDQTMTRGIVSAINRLLPDVPLAISEPVIQTDAAINPGNSGGPLVNSRGEVIGINTAILPEAQGIGFAVPIGLVEEIIPKLLKDGRVIRPWLGVQGQLIVPEIKELFRLPLVDGFLIEVVEPGSPAERADLKGGDFDVTVSGQGLLLGGDIITAINGFPVATPAQITASLGAMKVGDTIKLEVFRAGKTLKVACTLPERPVLPSDVRSSRTMAPMSAVPVRRPNPRLVF